MTTQAKTRLADLRTQIRSLSAQYELAESQYNLLSSFVFISSGAIGTILSYAISVDRQIVDQDKWEGIQQKKRKLLREMGNIKAVREELQEREKEVLGLALGDGEEAKEGGRGNE